MLEVMIRGQILGPPTTQLGWLCLPTSEENVPIKNDLTQYSSKHGWTLCFPNNQPVSHEPCRNLTESFPQILVLLHRLFTWLDLEIIMHRTEENWEIAYQYSSSICSLLLKILSIYLVISISLVCTIGISWFDSNNRFPSPECGSSNAH